jgi:hypothetical protein
MVPRSGAWGKGPCTGGTHCDFAAVVESYVGLLAHASPAMPVALQCGMIFVTLPV